MMPLMFANTGETNIIKKVGGSPEVKKHLEKSRFCCRRRGYHYFVTRRKCYC